MSSINYNLPQTKFLRDGFLYTLRREKRASMVAGARIRLSSVCNNQNQNQNPNKFQEEQASDQTDVQSQETQNKPETTSCPKADQKLKQKSENLSKAITKLTTHFNDNSNANQLQDDLGIICELVSNSFEEFPIQYLLDSQILDTLIEFFNDYFND